MSACQALSNVTKLASHPGRLPAGSRYMPLCSCPLAVLRHCSARKSGQMVLTQTYHNNPYHPHLESYVGIKTAMLLCKSSLYLYTYNGWLVSETNSWSRVSISWTPPGTTDASMTMNWSVFTGLQVSQAAGSTDPLLDNAIHWSLCYNDCNDQQHLLLVLSNGPLQNATIIIKIHSLIYFFRIPFLA